MYTRRTVVKGAVSLSLAAILADPILARAAAMGLETTSITTAGGRTVSGALALPSAAKAPAIALVHEWWGLNDQIKAVAAEFAKQGYVALAVDLFDGKVATTAAEAQAQMQAMNQGQAGDALASWIDWLRRDQRGNGKVATIGWCFGGGWSLNGSLSASVDATVIYYGNVKKSAADLKPLKGPVLGHFATRDTFINKPMVEGFVAAMKEAGKSLEHYWYDANHAFANPTGASYDEPDARLAWRRTLAFLNKTM